MYFTVFLLGVSPNRDLRYCVKIINPESKGGYLVEEFMDKKFISVYHYAQKWQRFLKSTSFKQFGIGYLQPGHGFKGKQFVLATDEDLKQMYNEHSGRKSINLWLKFEKKKRTRDTLSMSDYPQPKRSKSCESHLAKMDELQSIVEKLKEIPIFLVLSFTVGEVYYTIQLGHHDSYEHPPKKPFFGASKTANTSSGLPPEKRIHLKSECTEQLTKWHKLMNDGVITKEEYEDMHKTIMGDIKEF